MAQLAAGKPFYENTWLAAGSIVLLLIILGTMLTLLIVIIISLTRWIGHLPKARRWIAAGVAYVLFVTISALVGYYINSSNLVNVIGSGEIASGEPSAQDLFQQRTTQDERALDKGVLTYPAMPTLKADLPTTLTVTVTDLGKHPDGSMTAQNYSQETNMVVYPRNVPAGGIVGLHLTCTSNVYCQALSSDRQAVVGLGTSQTWNWDLTPLQSGPTSVAITAATYDGATNTILSEEIIPISLQVEKGAWWAAVDDWWHAITGLATTTAGLITAIGGAAVVIAGAVQWVRRKRTRKIRAQPEAKTSVENETNAEREALPETGES